MWIGPVEVHSISTTVLPTAVNPVELIPPPTLGQSNVPAGAQLPLLAKNESWAFPKDFLWGVASASYQVEGAVMDEGRGPSIWDAYSHRVKGYIYNNDTGDITDNHYYLYKQGMKPYLDPQRVRPDRTQTLHASRRSGSRRTLSRSLGPASFPSDKGP